MSFYSLLSFYCLFKLFLSYGFSILMVFTFFVGYYIFLFHSRLFLFVLLHTEACLREAVVGAWPPWFVHLPRSLATPCDVGPAGVWQERGHFMELAAICLGNGEQPRRGVRDLFSPPAGKLVSRWSVC